MNPRHTTPLLPLLPLVSLVIGAACSSAPETRDAVSRPGPAAPVQYVGSAYEAAAQVVLPEVEPVEAEGLHNVFRLSDRILSGDESEGPAALQQLVDWGVRTILSVDGKIPDAEAAEALGMRYVHVPIQYDGIDPDEMLAIAKTFRELEGPFYVHCYHGKHRGPAAAAIGRVVLDGVPREKAMAEMRQWCSTSSKYEGLYATVAAAQIPTEEESARFQFDFSPAHRFEGMRAVMIQLARTFDRVKAAEKRGWMVDPEHPDVAPAHEVTQLHQLFEAFADLGASHAWEDDFRMWLEKGRQATGELSDRLNAAGDLASLSDEELGLVEPAFNAVGNACSSCHAVYRD